MRACVCVYLCICLLASQLNAPSSCVRERCSVWPSVHGSSHDCRLYLLLIGYYTVRCELMKTTHCISFLFPCCASPQHNVISSITLYISSQDALPLAARALCLHFVSVSLPRRCVMRAALCVHVFTRVVGVCVSARARAGGGTVPVRGYSLGDCSNQMWGVNQSLFVSGLMRGDEGL